MKKYISYFKEFHKDYFSYKLYLLILLFTAVLTTFNYMYDIEDSFIDSYRRSPLRTLLFFLYHGLGYYGALAIIYFYNKKLVSIKKGFWLKSAIGLFILSADRSITPFIASVVLDDVVFGTYRFYLKVLDYSHSWVNVFAVLAIVKYVYDRKEDYGLYGLRLKKVDFKSYFYMLLIMVPIIAIASFMQEFIDFYPVYKRSGGARFAEVYEMSELYSIIIYEVSYLLSFFKVEVIFRGFLIIGLAKLIGKNVVIPMAVTYAVLHFGKPVGETISSLFGGYILGVISLYTRNIWGGVFVHCGIALLMEVFAFAQQ